MLSLRYIERGMAYESLEKYEEALNDYSGISINPDKFFLLSRIRAAKILGRSAIVENDMDALKML